jgi:hypothetical protein
MAKRSRQTFQKHQKEHARQQKQNTRPLDGSKPNSDGPMPPCEGRQTTRPATCTSAGSSCQRADITAATTGVMVQECHQVPHVRHGTPRLGREPGEDHR